jgi:hypothetical protein
MSPRTFLIPDEENPEPGVPETITHGCDYMRLPDGKLEYHYNFLIYTWRSGGEEISARAYLDEPAKVSIFVQGSRLTDEAALQPIVRYLQRRFLLIQSFHADDAGTDGTGHNVVFRNERY